MTRKPAKPQDDVSGSAEGESDNDLPAFIQPERPAVTQQPDSGGSYVRQPDGSLKLQGA